MKNYHLSSFKYLILIIFSIISSLCIQNTWAKDEQAVTKKSQATHQYYKVEAWILNRRLDDWEMKNNKPVKRYISNNKKNNDYFQVKAIENQPAFIKTQEQEDRYQISDSHSAFLPKQSRKTLLSGYHFKIKSKSNSQVEIHYAANNQTRKNQQTTQITRVASAVVANLNHWILVASHGGSQNNSSNSSSKHYTTSSKRNNKQWHYLRVSEINSNNN